MTGYRFGLKRIFLDHAISTWEMNNVQAKEEETEEEACPPPPSPPYPHVNEEGEEGLVGRGRERKWV